MSTILILKDCIVYGRDLKRDEFLEGGENSLGVWRDGDGKEREKEREKKKQN